jgi:hypothetical protein
MQVDFIQELLAMDQLKAAVQSVNDLGLADEFPGLERRYRGEVVAQLLAKGRWAVAAKFVGDDAVLQEQARSLTAFFMNALPAGKTASRQLIVQLQDCASWRLDVAAA